MHVCYLPRKVNIYREYDSAGSPGAHLVLCQVGFFVLDSVFATKSQGLLPLFLRDFSTGFSYV